MPIIYGDNQILEDMRIALAAQMTAMIAAMVTASVSPRPAASYNTLYGDLALTFPAVSVGFEEVDAPWVGPSSGVSTTDWMARAVVRIMIGNANAFRDEVTYYRLANSVSNWLKERHVLDDVPRIHYISAITIRPMQAFEDNRTIGGELTFMVRSSVQYTSA